MSVDGKVAVRLAGVERPPGRTVVELAGADGARIKQRFWSDNAGQARTLGEILAAFDAATPGPDGRAWIAVALAMDPRGYAVVVPGSAEPLRPGGGGENRAAAAPGDGGRPAFATSAKMGRPRAGRRLRTRLVREEPKGSHVRVEVLVLDGERGCWSLTDNLPLVGADAAAAISTLEAMRRCAGPDGSGEFLADVVASNRNGRLELCLRSIERPSGGPLCY